MPSNRTRAQGSSGFIPHLGWKKTALGTAIDLFASHPLADLKGKSPILIMGGIHGDEPEGVRLAHDILKWLKDAPRPIVPWIMIPCLNVDGFQKNTRVNGQGVDLNRNYPSTNWSKKYNEPRYYPGITAASELEIQAVVELIEQVSPRLIIHCHSWNPCIVGTGERAQKDALRLSQSSGYQVVPEIGYPTPGSLSQYGWHDHQIPIICIEEQEHLENLDEIWPRFAKGISEILYDFSDRRQADTSTDAHPPTKSSNVVHASVLVINHPDKNKINFGADFIDVSHNDFTSAKIAISNFAYSVIALPANAGSLSELLSFLDYVNTVSPHAQRVIIENGVPAHDLLQIVNSGSVFRILSHFEDSNFELSMIEALEEYRQLQQNFKLMQLVNEQNDRLKRLTLELEERVEIRRKSLEDSKQRLLATNRRAEALHRALVAIHRAGSIGEMERFVNEALQAALGLTWTRILFQSQGKLNAQDLSTTEMISICRVPLSRGKDVLGQIYFARDARQPFSREENAFLSQIGEAVSLAIDRLTKLEQSETLKQQWEATFDAILDPVSLIDSDFNVIRINKSFAQFSGQPLENIIGSKCYHALFGRTSPCENCQVKNISHATFRLKPHRLNAEQQVIFDVFSQRIQFHPDDNGDHYVNLYHDVSPQLQYERQILESAKMAELGTIGSSIAHELNNPLGGMLTFLQLIKMGADGSENWYQDIADMEAGARRCRDIVQSLLGFTRKSSQDENDLIDLSEVIQQALKITELQTRAAGIQVQFTRASNPYMLKGQFNALAQALRNCLLTAQESIANKNPTGLREPGVISVNCIDSPDTYLIEINDNGLGFEPPEGEDILHFLSSSKSPLVGSGLGLSVAQQILRDHGGSLEMTSTKGSGMKAIISLPRPVFGS